MNTTRRIRSLFLAATVAATSLAVGALPAAAADREREGDCSARSDWDLELDRDDGEIEVDLEIDGRRAGERWRVVIKQNGSVFFDATRRADDDGDVDIERDRPDTSGTDRFWFRATSVRTGEVCQGSLRI